MAIGKPKHPVCVHGTSGSWVLRGLKRN